LNVTPVRLFNWAEIAIDKSLIKPYDFVPENLEKILKLLEITL
jgi:hypothetical protein